MFFLFPIIINSVLSLVLYLLYNVNEERGDSYLLDLYGYLWPVIIEEEQNRT